MVKFDILYTLQIAVLREDNNAWDCLKHCPGVCDQHWLLSLNSLRSVQLEIQKV